MGFFSNMSCNLIHLVVSILLVSSVHGLNNLSTDSLDVYLQDFAVGTMGKHRLHTGNLYETILPENLSGMKVSVVRLRSRRLWSKGANFSCFSIPSNTLTVPYVRRVSIVYQDLGNWSSHYYAVPGYNLLTSVVGFMVFDASNASVNAIRNISLNTMGRPISIRFPNSNMSARTRCVAFGVNRTVSLSETSLDRVCYWQDQGHFSIVVPMERKQRCDYLWVIGVVIGFLMLVSVGYVGVRTVRSLKTKKIQVMERRADEDLVLKTIWVGSSKLPSATVTRTLPVLENGGFQ